MPDENRKDDWKREYLALLAEMEAREVQWGETEAFFRQGLSRLSLAADGIDQVLDDLLQGLRESLRAGAQPEKLREQLDLISRSIHRLENTRAFGGPARRAPPGLLGRLFGKAGVSSRNGAEAEHLRLSVAKTLLKELTENLLGKAAGADLLGWLEQAESEVQVYNLGHELVTRLSPALDSPGGDGPRGGLKAHEVLLRLLERIEVPSELGGRRDEIRQMLLAGGARERTEEALRAIADLVAEIRGRAHQDRVDTETFLSQVADRLNEIDALFQESAVMRREGFEQGQVLGRKVDDQVNEIEASVGRSQDLDSLKSTLRLRIDVIRAHMRDYRENEEQRLLEAERQVERLNERLQSVQHESDELRRSLEQERGLAMVDPLTGIANRSAYNERLALEVARWKRYRSPLTLAVWDVDCFKRVNDQFGHQAGDKALAQIARVIRTQIRETDFVARYGGEEFVMLLPETTLAEGAAAAENVRRAVMECGFHYHGNPVTITVSCGMTEFRGGDTAQDAFARADAALYRAKAQGRNRCVTG